MTSEKPESCWLCERPLGRRVQWHHTVPKAKKGRETVPVHPICHKTIHLHFTNAQLVRIDGERVHVGGMTRQRAVLESGEIAARAPVITEALGFVGHVQTRNRGTVGGSLAHMDPAAELMGIAALFDAEITLASKRGERRVPIAEYPLGYMTPNIEPDEILTSVSFDLWPVGHGYDFREFAQRHGDFAVVGVGSQLTLDQGGRIDRAAVVLIGVDDGPVRLNDVEKSLVGEAPSDALFRAAGAMAAKHDMMGDALITADYRSRVADAFVRRSLTRAAERAQKTARETADA